MSRYVSYAILCHSPFVKVELLEKVFILCVFEAQLWPRISSQVIIVVKRL